MRHWQLNFCGRKPKRPDLALAYDDEGIDHQIS